MKSICVWMVWMCVVGAPTWASGQPAEEEDATKQALVSAVSGALETGRFSEAYGLAYELVARDGEDPRSRALAATAAVTTARMSEALDHVDAGLRARPDDVELRSLRASIKLYLDDEAGARADASRAVEMDPDAQAREILLELELTELARERLAGAAPGLPPDSPAYFVDRICKEVSAGAWPAVLTRHLDLDLLTGLSSERRDVRTLRSLVEGVLDSGPIGNRSVLGWYVEPTVAQDGDRWYVTVWVPMLETFTPQRLQMTALAYADPQLRETLDPSIRAMLDGSPSEEHPALLDRMQGMRSRAVLELGFEVVRRGAVYRVTDVVRGGLSIRALVADLAPEIEAEDRVAPIDPARLAGRIVGGLVMLGLCIWLVLWLRKR